MTASRPLARRRGIMLTEMVIVLALIAFLATVAIWGLLVQMDTQRRLLLQADRQAALRSCLRQLRRDLAVTSAIEFDESATRLPADWHPIAKSVFRAAAPLRRPSDRMPMDLSPVRLNTPDGVVRYHLRVMAPLYAHPDDTTEQPAPIQETLVRTGADGAERTWQLYGQSLELLPGPGDPRRLLRVRSTSRMKYGTGHHKIRRYETTLLAGGAS